MIHEPSSAAPKKVTALRAMPEGCACDPNSWSGVIYPICKLAREQLSAETFACPHCEHSPECHAANTTHNKIEA
jgi:hypothetical protein